MSPNYKLLKNYDKEILRNISARATAISFNHTILNYKQLDLAVEIEKNMVELVVNALNLKNKNIEVLNELLNEEEFK